MAALFHDDVNASSRAGHTKAVISRAAKGRSQSTGALVLAAALSLCCFLLSDYLLHDDTPCDGIGIVPPSYLQTHLWIAENGWPYYTLSRLLLTAVIFVLVCVILACILGFSGFRPS